MPRSRVYRVIGSTPRSGVILCEVGPLHDQAPAIMVSDRLGSQG
jgi:hypothetical protein